ncbi:MAG: hypothetical protein V2B14_03510 [bacterium]
MKRFKSLLFIMMLMSLTGIFEQKSNAQGIIIVEKQQKPVVQQVNQQKTTQQPENKAQIIDVAPQKQQASEIKDEKATNELLSPDNILGLTASEEIINKTFDLIKKNKLAEAKNLIEPEVEWLENATEYHTELYKVLKGLDTAKAQSDIERELALQFAILRDKASYQLALLYIEEKKLKQAVEKLVDVVQSQPKTKLGFEAYQVLQQIGFTYKLQLPK